MTKPRLVGPPDPDSVTGVDVEETESAPTPTGDTLADQVDRNASLIRELADKYDIAPEALVQLFATTMNVHFTKLQLGLSAPVES